MTTSKTAWRSGLVLIPGSNMSRYSKSAYLCCFTTERGAWIHREEWIKEGIHEFSILPFEQDLEFIKGAAKQFGNIGIVMKDENGTVVAEWLLND